MLDQNMTTIGIVIVIALLGYYGWKMGYFKFFKSHVDVKKDVIDQTADNQIKDVKNAADSQKSDIDNIAEDEKNNVDNVVDATIEEIKDDAENQKNVIEEKFSSYRY